MSYNDDFICGIHQFLIMGVLDVHSLLLGQRKTAKGGFPHKM
jgi:hypothetical protein